jgi:hypothetical protein
LNTLSTLYALKSCSSLYALYALYALSPGGALGTACSNNRTYSSPSVSNVDVITASRATLLEESKFVLVNIDGHATSDCGICYSIGKEDFSALITATSIDGNLSTAYG